MAGMGWHRLTQPYKSEQKRRPCKCGKGEIIEYLLVEEESEMPPFEKGTETVYRTTCPDNCEGL